MVRLISLLTFPGRITERRTPLNDFEFFLISDKVLMKEKLPNLRVFLKEYNKW